MRKGSCGTLHGEECQTVDCGPLRFLHGRLSRKDGKLYLEKPAPLEKSVTGGDYKYLLIDEVVNGWCEEGNFSIFVMESNLYLLSGELVTKLVGYYLEFNVYTLSFAEYLGIHFATSTWQNSSLHATSSRSVPRFSNQPTVY
jgi:predicted AAA+ superfamily ATPase